MIYKRLIRKTIKFRLDSLIEYNEFVETNIKKELNKIQKEFDKVNAEYEESKKSNPNIDDEDNGYIDYFDQLSYNNDKLTEDVVLNHRNSFIFLLYSFLENELHSYAKSFEKNTPFDIDDLKGNSIFEKFKLYLSKTDTEKFEKIQSNLLFFDRVRLIRNVITHNSNIIKDNNSHFNKIKEFRESRFTLEPIGVLRQNYEGYKIILEHETFINEIGTNINLLFDKLYDQDGT